MQHSPHDAMGGMHAGYVWASWWGDVHGGVLQGSYTQCVYAASLGYTSYKINVGYWQWGLSSDRLVSFCHWLPKAYLLDEVHGNL